MSNQPPQSPPPGGYDPNAARGGGYDPNATTPMSGGTPGGYTPPPAGGGYGAPPPGGGYGAPPTPGGPGYYGGPPAGPVGTSWAAIVSLIAGVLSIITCCIWCISIPLGVAAVALYFVAQGQTRQGMGGRGLAIAGLITGIIGILLGLLGFAAPNVVQDMPFWSDVIATMTAIANP